ncbi:uncharacterized protein LOC124264765 [Haliotis rubra]|uniref:uncharacterized protein LOC124264765 n=1 Tax=Haliotis rubra TaxID=36100 RepID=UPI001EE5FC01|nr:uncharacterized protein LOC124264765 [Haliotis rubra]
MLLSIPDLVFTFSCILVRDGLHVKAANIMLGKPTRLSSTYSAPYQSGYANDGNRTGESAISPYQLHPYWQGDLQGFYTVHNITVTIYSILRCRYAYIGVSSVDVDCPNDDVTLCGQWPADAVGRITLTFNCSHEQPVRFVRVWKNITDYLSIQEVEVEGHSQK